MRLTALTMFSILPVRGSFWGGSMLPFQTDMLEYEAGFDDITDMTYYPVRRLCIDRSPQSWYYGTQACCPCAQRFVKKTRQQRKNWVQKMDLRGYRPDEISIKTKDGFLSVVAKTEYDNEDGMSYISETTRRVKLPDYVNPEEIRSFIKHDGTLMLKAPVRKQTNRAITFDKNKGLPGNMDKNKEKADSDEKIEAETMPDTTAQESIEKTCSVSMETTENHEHHQAVNVEIPVTNESEHKEMDNVNNVTETESASGNIETVKVEDIDDESDNESVEKDENAEEIITR